MLVSLATLGYSAQGRNGLVSLAKDVCRDMCMTNPFTINMEGAGNLDTFHGQIGRVARTPRGEYLWRFRYQCGLIIIDSGFQVVVDTT